MKTITYKGRRYSVASSDNYTVVLNLPEKERHGMYSRMSIPIRDFTSRQRELLQTIPTLKRAKWVLKDGCWETADKRFHVGREYQGTTSVQGFYIVDTLTGKKWSGDKLSWLKHDVENILEKEAKQPSR